MSLWLRGKDKMYMYRLEQKQQPEVSTRKREEAKMRLGSRTTAMPP